MECNQYILRLLPSIAFNTNNKSKCEYEDLRWAIQFTIDSIYTDRWTINTHAGELPPPWPGNCYINVFLIGLDGN